MRLSCPGQETRRWRECTRPMDATVLLVMDVQRGVVERFGEDPGYLPRLAGAITAARGAGVPVVYVTIGFRPGHPEVSARNRTFSALAAAGGFTEGGPAAEIHPVMALMGAGGQRVAGLAEGGGRAVPQGAAGGAGVPGVPGRGPLPDRPGRGEGPGEG